VVVWWLAGGVLKVLDFSHLFALGSCLLLQFDINTHGVRSFMDYNSGGVTRQSIVYDT